MKWFLVVALYTVLCKLYLFLVRQSDKKLLRVVAKCAPIAFLIFLVGKEVSESNAPVTSSSPGSRDRLSRLLWALLFSCIGDAYLVFSNYFIYGVVAFAISQMLLFTVFGGSVSLLFEADRSEIVAGLAIALISLTIYLYLFPKLKGVIVFAAGVYCTLISLMLWSAVVQFQRRPGDMTMVGVVGAVMFYSSDVMLSVNKWRFELPYAEVLIMVTYYTAQLFITGSVLGIE